MDFYSYYKERLTWGGNPYESVSQCQRVVAELMENPVIPDRISTESAVGFLTALADFAGDGCSVVRVFDTTMDSLVDELNRMRQATDTIEQEWFRETLEAEYSGPPYEPGDYEVRPEDMDGADLPEEPEREEEPDLLELERLYGIAGEPGTTGTRRPFPDWEHVDSWTQGDWIKLQTYKSKMLAAAGHDFFAMGSVTNALAAAKDAMPRVPLPRQVELAMWAEELVDLLISGMESSLREMCAGSLHSHQGRLVQKRMLSTANGQPQNGPD